MARTELREWLQGEMRGWERDGLVSPDQSRAILARYPAPAVERSWGMLLFSSLGAVIVGLGLILLLAYNWDAIPKAAKLAMVIGSVAATHLAGVVLRARSDRYRILGEGLSLLGTMLFGAGIFLVAQIYNIGEHFPNALAIWGFGALCLALVMPSIPQATLAAVLLTAWSGAERIAFDAVMLLAPVALAGALGPLAYVRRSRLLLAVLIPAFFISYGFMLPCGGEASWLLFSALLSLAAFCLALSFLVPGMGSFPGSAPVLGFYGASVFLVMLYLLCFPGLAHEFFRWQRAPLTWPRILCGAIPLAFTVLAWGEVARRKLAGTLAWIEGEAGAELFLIPLVVVLAVFDLGAGSRLEGWVIAGPFNLVFIGLAAAMMARGCREGLIKQTITGSVLLVLLVVARYFDLFESQLTRGFAFVATGGLLLVEGFFYARAKRRKAEGDIR